MDKSIKTKLSIYGILSCLTYMYLIMQSRPGISVPLFFVIQFIFIYYIVKDNIEVKNKSGIMMFIPIVILSINYFISASNLFKDINFFIIIILYSTMILIMNNRISTDKMSFDFILKIIANSFAPFINFPVPFKWIKLSRNGGSFEKYKIKQILFGVLLSIPCVIFLFMMLSAADMIFSEMISTYLTWISSLFDLEYIFKFLFGTFAGLYLFGHLYNVFSKTENVKINKNQNRDYLTPSNKIGGDLIVINIMLVSILAVYTIFILIQFRYLFSGANLPYGLNYSEYARRGFFELVFLSIINIGLILLSVFLLKDKIYQEKTKWSEITKIFLLYLCLLTTLLLISSFYRMMLYDNEYGYTRLRIIVYLFLIFEAAGLLFTFKFIFKPNFNIIALYMFIGLIYYLTLNVIQIDNIIAKRNIDMYLNNKTESIDINYLMLLSVDAAPQIMRLLNNDEVDFTTKYKAKAYFEKINMIYNDSDLSWQNYNSSIERAKKLINNY